MAFRVKTHRMPVMTSFYVDEISYVIVTKDPQGDGLKRITMTTDQVRAARHSSDYEENLRNLYFEVTLNKDADEQLADELFQAFGALISVKFKNRVFTRREL